MGKVFGVGINDLDSVTQKFQRNKNGTQTLIWYCPFYRRWKDMLMRCYSAKYQKKRETYKGCSVCDEWLYFSNFKSWMENQKWEGKVLDKDLKFKNNKVYSPQTCLFIEPLVNRFITYSSKDNGLLKGVSKGPNGEFICFCHDPCTKRGRRIGTFNSEIEAHNAWILEKKRLTYVLLENGHITDYLKDLLIKYYSE